MKRALFWVLLFAILLCSIVLRSPAVASTDRDLVNSTMTGPLDTTFFSPMQVTNKSSFVIADLRKDLPAVYNAGDYQVHLLADALPTTGDPDDFTTAWLGVFLDEYDWETGSGQFSQIGIKADQDGIYWFVFAEPGVECLRGTHPDPEHCYGYHGDLVGLGTWHKVELVKYAHNDYWIARVYYNNNTMAQDVAKIWSTSERIWLARSDTEEGYFEADDPYMTVSLYHWHPQYHTAAGWQEWPVSSGGNISKIWTWPDDICPDHYGATPNYFGDERSWFAGTGGQVCDWLLFPSAHVYLPGIHRNYP